ncbi:MAG: replication initiator [Streptosporangiaceae bacterium]
MTTRTTRAERMAQPRAADAIKTLAEAAGGCVRPIQLRRTNLDTGRAEPVLVPCGSPLESVCRSCAERCKSLRAQQCREGWHLDDEPVIPPAPPDGWQTWLLEKRAELQVLRDQAAASGQDTAELDELIRELDAELAKTGIRGHPDPAKKNGAKRKRSTRRRQDAPALPRRKVAAQTTGKVYTAKDGKTFRPSMFLTLTLDSYGKVREDGTPANPDSYDYRRAARDVLHFAALADRFIQNLRRYEGFDVQYFGTVEPQRRLAPHLHLAIRGTVPRADLRQVIAATDHQVWWPATEEVQFEGEHQPVWHEGTGNYVDPDTGEVLQSWDDALDAIGPAHQPRHVVRFGPKFDAQGVLAGSKDSGRCIRYLTKYLTKHISGCHSSETEAQQRHADRLVDELRYEPCSPRCANWLRYGIQPKGARKGQRPGACRGKAHRADNLGYAGRRVLNSRKWSGKTLADHRADRKAWLLDMLGLPDQNDTVRYRWEQVTPSDTDFMTHGRRMLHVLADRARWQSALAEARRRADEATGNLPATREAA